MSDRLQAAKEVTLTFHRALEKGGAEGASQVLAKHTAGAEYRWRGMHPFGDVTGAGEVAEQFWQPFLSALAPVQRRQDVFFAGENLVEDTTTVWTCSMGHLMGLFDKPWLGIPPTRKIAMLRYVEFNRIEDGRIAESAMFFDILHLILQAGLQPLPPQTGAHLVQPGPRTNDGLLFDPQPDEESLATHELIERMVDDINNPGRYERREDELRQHWAEDMLWWGPAGIGASYTIERYIEQHAGPFRAHLTDRGFHGHKAYLTEGKFGGFFGWPNLTMKSPGGYLGLPGSDNEAEMRVVDIYRREGDKLAENWIFIDILHFLKCQGVDVLERLAKVPRT